MGVSEGEIRSTPALWNDTIDSRDVEHSEGFEDNDSE